MKGESFYRKVRLTLASAAAAAAAAPAVAGCVNKLKVPVFFPSANSSRKKIIVCDNDFRVASNFSATTRSC